MRARSILNTEFWFWVSALQVCDKYKGTSARLNNAEDLKKELESVLAARTSMEWCAPQNRKYAGIPFWKTLLSDCSTDESSPSWIETGQSERSILKTEYFWPHYRPPSTCLRRGFTK